MSNEKGYIFDLQPPPYQPQRSLRVPTLRRRRAKLALLATGAALALVLLYCSRLVDTTITSAQDDVFTRGLEYCREIKSRKASIKQPFHLRSNPRWNPVSGQNGTTILQNATLFDGESIQEAVDLTFERGLITSVSKHGASALRPEGVEVYDLGGRFVTPGLVDIHSHHLEMPFAHVVANQDVNEKPHLSPITPFVRAIDGFKPYDPAIQIIASGGVTTSLNLPGSGNIIGGQAYLVKNLPSPGENAEPVVEDLLFDHGLSFEERQRYLKMACGENPKYRYEHTRLGNAWLLRQHLEKARKLQREQDAWCKSADAFSRSSKVFLKGAAEFLGAHGEVPESLELEATVALLRGEFNVNIHCYEPEDLERMLDVLHEFGVHLNAFHHALEAWQVPEFLKQQERNITIATFAENALFKHEAYGANLRGPKILDDHGVRVVLKSDHTGEGNFAKYLLDQASVSHSFGLSELKALQSVTSAAAYSIQQDHRVGYVRAGYDADLVVWDSHPLAVGATPVQVFVDGREILSKTDFAQITTEAAHLSDLTVPNVRAIAPTDYKHKVCTAALSPDSILVFTGIRNVFLDRRHFNTTISSDLTLVISKGRVQCLGLSHACASSENLASAITISLVDGYITPGLVAFGNTIGIQDISSEASTGDGVSSLSSSLESSNVPKARNGIHFHSRSFDRARLGGVTRAITPPLFGGGVVHGVSVGISTSENATLLDGVWKDEVALHMHVGQDAKGGDTSTISSGVERLYQIFTAHAGKNDGSIYSRAANGSLPVIVHTLHPNDIEQVILLKRKFPDINFAIYGGHGAPLVSHCPHHSKGPMIMLTKSDRSRKRWPLPRSRLS